MEDVNEQNDCFTWLKNGTCRHGAKCYYAHEEDKKNSAPDCFAWVATGRTCEFGTACRFKHETTKENSVRKDCHAWADHGYCRFGNQCMYAHDLDKKGEQKDCYSWIHTGGCDRGDACYYKHDSDKAKTGKRKDCFAWLERGSCRNGDGCRYAHDLDKKPSVAYKPTRNKRAPMSNAVVYTQSVNEAIRKLTPYVVGEKGDTTVRMMFILKMRDTLSSVDTSAFDTFKTIFDDVTVRCVGPATVCYAFLNEHGTLLKSIKSCSAD